MGAASRNELWRIKEASLGDKGVLLEYSAKARAGHSEPVRHYSVHRFFLMWCLTVSRSPTMYCP